MSDYDDDEFMCDNVGDEDEDYDLEYSEDSNSEPDVDLENAYYNSKALKEESPSSALESFQRHSCCSKITLILAPKMRDYNNFITMTKSHLRGTKDIIDAPLDPIFEQLCPKGAGPGRGRGEGRVGLQGPEADDQDQLQAGQLQGDDGAVQAAADVH